MIEEIETALEGAGQADELIAAFNQFTGRDFDEHLFRNYWRGVSLDDLVRQASRPRPTATPDVTREELVEIVRRGMPTSDDPDYEYYLEIFEANVPLPCASNLLFYPEDYDFRRDNGEDYDPTPEEVVDVALRYEVVALPSTGAV